MVNLNISVEILMMISIKFIFSIKSAMKQKFSSFSHINISELSEVNEIYIRYGNINK